MPVACNFNHVWDIFDDNGQPEMEGLTAEQAAQQAQWGPDIGPPGPVSYIMNVIQSQQAKDDESAIPSDTEPTTSGPDDSPSQQAPEENQQPTSTPTLSFNSVSSDSTNLPSTIETSTSILSTSTSQETSSSATSDIPSFTSDPATNTDDQPLFSLSIPTTSSTSTSASAESTYVLSYEPISGSISYAPTSSSSFVTSASATSTPSHTLAADVGSHTEGSTASSDMIHMSNSRKQAIVGGLAGAIGVLVILGLLLCFCLRRRQKRADDDDDEDEEEGLKKPVKKPMTLGTKASTVRLWTTLGRDTSRSTPEISRPKTAATMDGSLASEQWTHPSARKEAMRGSLEPAPLNVVNSTTANHALTHPSATSGTPPQENEEQEGKPGFIRKQRSALATLLQDGPRTNSRNAVRRGPISYPKPVAGDPVYSSKAKVEDSRLSTTTEGDETAGQEAGEGETQSVGSLPSDTSSLMVVQQPPADPFFASTTMLSTMEEVAPPMQDSPAKQQQQQAPELSRSISHFGKNANPFRTQIVPSVALPPRIFSYSNPNFRASDAARIAALNNSEKSNHARKSSMGSSYSRRQTAGTTILPSKRSSDQFDLMVSPENQMPPASGILAKTAEFEQREEEKKKLQQQNQREETPAESSSPAGSSPNWYVYEGT